MIWIYKDIIPYLMSINMHPCFCFYLTESHKTLPTLRGKEKEKMNDRIILAAIMGILFLSCGNYSITSILCFLFLAKWKYYYINFIWFYLLKPGFEKVTCYECIDQFLSPNCKLEDCTSECVQKFGKKAYGICHVSGFVGQTVTNCICTFPPPCH